MKPPCVIEGGLVALERARKVTGDMRDAAPGEQRPAGEWLLAAGFSREQPLLVDHVTKRCSASTNPA